MKYQTYVTKVQRVVAANSWIGVVKRTRHYSCRKNQTLDIDSLANFQVSGKRVEGNFKACESRIATQSLILTLIGVPS
jgi:hypothetical protein